MASKISKTSSITVNGSRGDSLKIKERQDPCHDHETFEILSAALRARKVSFKKLFRCATISDRFLMAFGCVFCFIAAICLAACIYLFGIELGHLKYGHKLRLSVIQLLISILGVCPPFFKLKSSRGHGWVIEVALGLAASTFIYTSCFHITSIRQTTRLRKKYMESLLRKNMCWFDSFVDRDLTRRVNHDTSNIRTAIGDVLPRLIFVYVSAVCMILISFIIQWTIALIACFLVPLYTAVVYLKSRADENLKESEWETCKLSTSVAAEVLSKIKTVKLFFGTSKAVSAYKASLIPPFFLNKNFILTSLWSGLAWFIPIVSYVILVRISITLQDLQDVNGMNETVKKREDAHMSWLGQDFYIVQETVLLYLVSTCHYLSYLPLLSSKLKKAQYSAAEIYFCLDWKSYIDNLSAEEDSLMSKMKAVGKLSLDKVSFNFPLKDKKRVLRNVNVVVEPCMMVAFAGLTRSGKTAALNLFTRLYETCRGTVMVDDIDVSKLNIQWLRAQFSVVSQQPSLLNATIEENVCGLKAYSEEEILAACRKANVLEELLALPKGLKTVVGLNSRVSLSMKLTKKILLARAILQDRRFIFLDDFFDDLSVEDVTAIVTTLAAQKDSSTIVLTCSKVNPVVLQACDSIFVFRDGRIVQRGTFKQLSSDPGYFSKDFVAASRNHFVFNEGKPKSESQLAFYKFAESIKRMHDFHDSENQVDFEELLHNPLATDSVLLRHDFSNQRKPTQPRIIGGFYRFVNYDFDQVDTYTEHVVRSSLLRDRDLRSKILPSPDSPGFAVIPSGQKTAEGKPTPLAEVLMGNKSKHKDGKTSSKGRTSGRVKAHKQKGEKTLSEVKKRMLKPATMAPLKPILKGAAPKPAQKTESASHKKSSSRPSGILSLGTTSSTRRGECDGKLQYYFGCTVNSPADVISISSVDSANFWNAYSDRLQVALEEKYQLETHVGVLKLAKYSWAYLLLAFFTSSILGFVVAATAFICATIGVMYLLTTKVDDYLYGALAVVAVIAFGAAAVQELFLAFGSYMANNKLRVALFTSMLDQDMQWFDEPKHDIGYLCEHLSVDVASVNTAFLGATCVYVESISILVGAFHVIYIAEEHIGLMHLVVLFLIFGVVTINYLDGYVGAKLKYVITNQYSRANELITDAVKCHQEIMLLGIAKEMLLRFEKSAARKTVVLVLIALGRSLIQGISMASFYLACGSWWITILHGGTVNAEDYRGCLSIVYILLYGCVSMGQALATVPPSKHTVEAAAIMVEAEAYSKCKRVKARRRHSLALGPLIRAPGLRLENIKFAYPSAPDVLILKSVSFEIVSESFVAIVGPKLAGKTTLVGIILRLYTPTEGSLFIEDWEYDEVDDSSLLNSVAVVEQDPDLFPSLSIAENIAYGDNTRKVRFLEIVEAAKLARIHDVVIKLNRKYQTKLEDLPTNSATYALKQRIAVARAAVRNSKFVIIDQATVSVDDENTTLLLQAIMDLKAGRTFLVTSERVAPVRNADTIVVMDKGAVVEMGTDDELLFQKGLYYDMYMRQRSFESRINAGVSPNSSLLQDNT